MDVIDKLLEYAFRDAATVNLSKVESITGGCHKHRVLVCRSSNGAHYQKHFDDYSLEKDPKSGEWNLECSYFTPDGIHLGDRVLGRFRDMKDGVMVLDSMAKALKFHPLVESDFYGAHISLKQAKRALEL